MTRYETKRYILAGIAGAFIIFLLSYGIFQARGLLGGPELTISSPTTGSLLSASLATITGKVENARRISVNDRVIDVDESGNFSEQLLMSYGYNIVTVKAVDRFGRAVEKTLQLVYK